MDCIVKRPDGRVSLRIVCDSSFFFFFSSRRRHTRLTCDWSSDVCSSDLAKLGQVTGKGLFAVIRDAYPNSLLRVLLGAVLIGNTIEAAADLGGMAASLTLDRKSVV